MKGILKKKHPYGYVPRLVALVLFAGVTMPATAETLYISKLATYPNPAKVRDEVRAECKPEVQLPALMREAIVNRSSIQNVVLTDVLPAEKAGLAMEVSILSLNTPPGASWTTEKRIMRVKTVVYRNGVIADEYTHYSDTLGGGSLFTKIFKNRSTCQIVERLARDISERTAERLKSMKWFQDIPPKSSDTNNDRSD